VRIALYDRCLGAAVGDHLADELRKVVVALPVAKLPVRPALSAEEVIDQVELGRATQIRGVVA
jgi:hypothetical protein